MSKIYRDRHLIYSCTWSCAWYPDFILFSNLNFILNIRWLNWVRYRDLHLNNILVTKRHYPNDSELPDEYSYLISDLGGGKRPTQQQDENNNVKPIAICWLWRGLV